MWWAYLVATLVVVLILYYGGGYSLPLACLGGAFVGVVMVEVMVNYLPPEWRLDRMIVAAIMRGLSLLVLGGAVVAVLGTQN
jgi:hypothetical protein